MKLATITTDSGHRCVRVEADHVDRESAAWDWEAELAIVIGRRVRRASAGRQRRRSPGSR